MRPGFHYRRTRCRPKLLRNPLEQFDDTFDIRPADGQAVEGVAIGRENVNMYIPRAELGVNKFQIDAAPLLLFFRRGRTGGCDVLV